MKLSENKKNALREQFHRMTLSQRADYIFTYYKAPILLALLALIVAGSVIYRQLVRKETVLYTAFANAAVGTDMENCLTSGFLEASGFDPKKHEVCLYKGLYLSDNADTLNHEYAYASSMKVMGSIQAQRLDVILMNREAYDLLSQKGYFLELPAFFAEWAPDLEEQAGSYYMTNEVILSDNNLDVALGTADSRQLVTEQAINGLLISNVPKFRTTEFDGDIYLGVIANSPRLEAVISYLKYLYF